MNTSVVSDLKWKKIPVLDQGYICLVDVMGDDSSIVQAAKVSYGTDTQENIINRERGEEIEASGNGDVPDDMCLEQSRKKDRNLIRYLMNHQHTTPFEMVEIKFMVQAPMDCWRQWIRHRTANVNEYSTRYTEAIDMQQTTAPDQWRLQATDNKQGSSGFITEWPHHCDGIEFPEGTDELDYQGVGGYLSEQEVAYHNAAKAMYQERLACGMAKEQARKDLPLSTYTRAYWKCDLHNIFNFLRLRMDSHAQLEIRLYANAMYEIVKQLFPISCEAFEDYVLNAKKFSAIEMKVLNDHLELHAPMLGCDKPESMSKREWTVFLEKVNQ